MKKPLFLPNHLKVNSQVEDIYRKMLELSEQYCNELRQENDYISIHTKSASYILTLSKILNFPKTTINRIDRSIKQAILYEKARRII